MPSLAEHQTDPEREAAFRRGYAHGVKASISGLVDLLSEEEKSKIETWFANVLGPWSRDPNQSQFLAPDFPSLDDEV
jgi:hypothetical protein